MEINSQGTSISSVITKLSEKVKKLRDIYDKDFYIKPEGVIDNIITAITFIEHAFQEQFAFLLKQLDPETAEREYQDALYERVGLYRRGATYTTFYKTVFGTPNSSVNAGEITLRHTVTNEEFSNNKNFILNSSGKALVEFQAEIDGNVIINSNDTLKIIQSPSNITDLGGEEISLITIGSEEENDIEFRARFHEIRNNRAKCTRDAIIQNLSEYVDYPQYLIVLDCNTDDTIEAGYILIIAKPNTTNEIFAEAILNNTLGGIKFLGNTTVNISLSNGTNWEVKFERADEILLEIQATIRLKSGFYENNVFTNIKNNIEKYVNNKAHGLNSTIYATEFIIPILETEGVEAITSISIKKDTDINYSDYINLSRNEMPIFNKTSIYLSRE